MDALLEAPAELETPEIEASEPVETGTESETEQPETQVEGVEVDSKAPLHEQAKDVLAKLKAEGKNGLAAKINDALRRDQQLSRDLPEGVKGAVALRNEVGSLAQALNDPAYQALSPAGVIADVKSQLGYFHGLDSLFTKGSPEFATKLSEASPEAFQTLAPAVFNEFAKVNPDGYSAYVSQVADSYMEGQGMSLEFQVLREFLPLMPEFTGKERVLAALEKIYGITQAVKTLASKPVTPVKKQDDAATLETQKQDLAAREIDVTRQSWNSNYTKFGTDLFNKEAARLSGKNPISEEDKGKMLAKVTDELDARLAATKGYGDAMRGYLQAKDSEGYKRRLHSEYQKLIPGATSRAYADVVSAKPVVAKSVARPVAAKSATVTPIADAGYRTVSKYPVGQVDVKVTTRKMMDEGKYILKDGSKVIYKRS